MKSFLSVGAAVVALLGLSTLAVASTPSSENPPEECKPRRGEAIEKQVIPATPRTDAPSMGSADAKVTVEVWSDFECPFCARGADTVKALRETYGDQVRIVFRHNPLPSHKNARLAAAASMAAHEQGKFWEFHDAIFANQDTLDRAALEAVAVKLNLDVERFRRALDSSTWNNYVDMERTESQRRRVTAAPTFFVNGKAIVGAQPLSVFAQTIDAALAH
ncbi:thioredoxin domain-containing protein [Stigmatella sp. ncwal1]|uniref:Thioredoxin domain-containing protein n=1 Tax=Stigmatella ashevillensis TaxID=2995309 RepID=A0ABT5DH78_9BACT|nr:DsbA family protein [Stigmatella ashevillena]MDC0712434.1 thioredoxin domain-containing protein [Stigmatella ashevillena]